MRCCVCDVEKLRREFPKQTLSSGCRHAPLYCLRCAVEAADDTQCCPYKDCTLPVDPEKVTYCQQLLDFLFPELEATEEDLVNLAGDGQEIFISTLDGDRTAVPYAPGITVMQVKEHIQGKLNVEANKQKLIYQDVQLEIYKEDGTFRTLADYGINNGAVVHLMVVLYAIPEHMDNVIFDLSWGYPSTGRDFLDATCFTYSHTRHRGVVNYDKKSWPTGKAAVSHSGDGMDDANSRGYHMIDVSLKQVPSDITHLLFTLSVWSSPSIAHFPSPILRFYDAANRDKDLCNTSLSDASDSEAVVMCYVVRKSNGKGWDIYESGQLSSGNAMNYDPLHDTARGIIQGFFRKKVGKSVVRSNVAPPVSAVRSAVSSGPRIVEIAFCFDTTGSMSNCIGEVKKKVKEVLSRLLGEMPNLRIAVFAHGDHDCPDPYVTTFIDFSKDVNRLCQFVTSVQRTGGGGDECYEFALYEMRRKLSWSQGSNKSIVMFGDSFPHKPNDPINIPRVDWRVEAKALFKEKGVRIYAVHCETRWNSHSFWKELAQLGHGKYLMLNNFNMVVDLLLAICYREAAPSLLKKFESELRSRASGAASMSSILDTLQ